MNPQRFPHLFWKVPRFTIPGLSQTRIKSRFSVSLLDGRIIFGKKTQVYLPKMMQVRKKPGIPGFFRVFSTKKARHGVAFLNETAPVWRDSNRRKNINILIFDPVEREQRKKAAPVFLFPTTKYFFQGDLKKIRSPFFYFR